MDIKVLIVEDELLTRKTLTKMINEQGNNLTVIETASNGLEAIEKIECHKPEIVLTDIRMPKMNGLELAKLINERYENIKVIMVTAYKDFEYAKAALRYDVSDFLLKPCSPTELSDVLTKVRKEIIEKQYKAKKERLLMERLALRSMILKLPYEREEINNIKKSYGNSTLFLLQVTNYYPEDKPYQKTDLELLQFSLMNIVGEIIHLQGEWGHVIPVTFDSFVCIIDEQKEGEEVALFILQKLRELLGIECNYERIQTLNEIKDIPFVFSSQTKNNVMVGNELASSKLLANNSVSEIKELLLGPLYVGEYKRFMEGLKHKVVEMEKLPIGELKRKALSLIYALTSISEKEFHKPFQFLLSEEIIRLQEYESKDKVADWLSHYVDQFVQGFNQWKIDNGETIVDRVKEYVNENYNGSCTLADVAEHVYLSPKYLSDTFKKQSGESYTNYVTKVRMKKASILLSNTTMKVTEIAKSVGYDDPNYFSTVFKKTYDLTPNKFRNGNFQEINRLIQG